MHPGYPHHHSRQNPAGTAQDHGRPDDPVKIDANRRYVVFTTNGYTIMSRLIEGDFLNYESVIPKTKRPG